MLSYYELEIQPRIMMTSHMLKVINDTPKNILTQMFQEYSDGILCGMRLEITAAGALRVTDGLYKANGNIWVMQETLIEEASQCREGITYALLLESDGTDLREEERCEDCALTRHQVRLVMREKQETDEHNPYVLCIFKGRPKLPTNCKELTDGVFNLLPCRYAAYQVHTFHPQVFAILLRELQAKKNKHPLDYTLIAEIARFGTAPIRLLQMYAAEAKKWERNLTQVGLIKAFLAAINELHLQYIVQEESEEQPKQAEAKGGILMPFSMEENVI